MPTIFGFLLLQTGSYLLQTDGVSKLILNVIQVSAPEPGRFVLDLWDCDEWGRIIPGSCIRRVG